MNTTDTTTEIIRAVCSCGHSESDPEFLELWNGYGDHGEGIEGEHAVSVWTLGDGSIVIADERESGHANDHATWQEVEHPAEASGR